MARPTLIHDIAELAELDHLYGIVKEKAYQVAGNPNYTRWLEELNQLTREYEAFLQDKNDFYVYKDRFGRTSEDILDDLIQRLTYLDNNFYIREEGRGVVPYNVQNQLQSRIDEIVNNLSLAGPISGSKRRAIEEIEPLEERLEEREFAVPLFQSSQLPPRSLSMRREEELEHIRSIPTARSSLRSRSQRYTAPRIISNTPVYDELVRTPLQSQLRQPSQPLLVPVEEVIAFKRDSRFPDQIQENDIEIVMNPATTQNDLARSLSVQTDPSDRDALTAYMNRTSRRKGTFPSFSWINRVTGETDGMLYPTRKAALERSERFYQL